MTPFESGIIVGACLGAGFTLLILALHQWLEGRKADPDHPVIVPVDYPLE